MISFGYLILVGEKGVAQKRRKQLSIKVNGKSAFYSKWRQNGIKQIKDLFDVPENCFLPVWSASQQISYKKTSFLHYPSLVSAIPREWKKFFVQKWKQSNTCIKLMYFKSEPLSCKILYQELLTRQKLPRRTAKKMA